MINKEMIELFIYLHTTKAVDKQRNHVYQNKNIFVRKNRDAFLTERKCRKRARERRFLVGAKRSRRYRNLPNRMMKRMTNRHDEDEDDEGIARLMKALGDDGMRVARVKGRAMKKLRLAMRRTMTTKSPLQRMMRCTGG